MNRFLIPLSLLVAVGAPTAALALPLETPAAAPSASAAPATVAPAGPSFKWSGYTRVRGITHDNFDLDLNTSTDNAYFQTDIRSYLTLDSAWERAHLVTSLDLAGSDFDQGGIMGFDTSTRQRPFLLSVRHLYLDYTWPELGLEAFLGRQPARLGLGIVSSINRDSFKLVKQVPDIPGFSKSNLTGVWVRGAKGLTEYPDQFAVPPGGDAPKGNAGQYGTNDPIGWAHELNTYALVYNTRPTPEQRLQVFYAHQIDSSQNGVYPQKRFLDANYEGSLGPLKLGGEAVWLGGQGPAANGARPELSSYAALLNGSYKLGFVDLGLSLGRGGGDNTPGDATNGNFQSLFIDESSFVYNQVFSDDLWGYNGNDAANGRGAGLANVTFLQPNLTFHFTPETTGWLSYTRHFASVPQKVGSGILGTGTTPSGDLTSNVGDELDARLSYTLGVTTFYAGYGLFVPGDIFAHPGWSNAAKELELGTELRF